MTHLLNVLGPRMECWILGKKDFILTINIEYTVASTLVLSIEVSNQAISFDGSVIATIQLSWLKMQLLSTKLKFHDIAVPHKINTYPVVFLLLSTSPLQSSCINPVHLQITLSDTKTDIMSTL